VNEVYQGDCLDWMELIDDQSIDMILCDLPYGTTKCKWDVVIPFDKLWAHYKRIIRPCGAIVLFCTQPFTSILVISNLYQFKYCWTWDKIIARGHLVAKKRPMQQTEDIAVFGKGKLTYYPQMIKRDEPIKGKESKSSMSKDEKNADPEAEFLIRLFGDADEIDREELDMLFEVVAPDLDAKEEVQKIAQAVAARLRERREKLPAHLESALKATKKKPFESLGIAGLRKIVEELKTPMLDTVNDPVFAYRSLKMECKRTEIMGGQSKGYKKGHKKIYTHAYPKTLQRFKVLGKKLHPTQKPVKLCEYLIKTYTQPDELVLDNCAGSGTTAIACMNTRRDYILIEKKPEYIEVCEQRITNRLEEMNLVMVELSF